MRDRQNCNSTITTYSEIYFKRSVYYLKNLIQYGNTIENNITLIQSYIGTNKYNLATRVKFQCVQIFLETISYFFIFSNVLIYNV